MGDATPVSVDDFAVSAADKRRASEHYRDLLHPTAFRLERWLARHFHAREQRAVDGLAAVAPGERVLDIGAGSGAHALRAKRRGAHVTVMDIVPELVHRLAPHVDAVHVGDLETMPLRDQFDCVLCLGVLDFVIHPGLALGNACGMVRPGGRLVLLVPTQTWAGRLYRLEKRLRGIQVNLFTPEWCERVAAAHQLQPARRVRPLANSMVMLLTRGR
jgi:2-polyprenyl-3-methyl-5-hydroxy-6-metoxy-1,4-benzoquinol methylase